MHSGSIWARLVSISSHRHQSKWYIQVIRCVTIVSQEVFFFLRLCGFVSLISELRDCPLCKTKPEKTAEILRRYHWFPREITSEERAEKFHTDDATLPITWLCIWLVQANFPHGTTNQKHYPDPGTDTSSVWNFYARSSDVISRDETSDGVAKCWIFPQAIHTTALIGIPVAFLFFFVFRLKS